MKCKFSIISIFLILFCLLCFTGCQDEPLRKAEYSKEEMEAYLEKAYHAEFTVLTRTEVYDSYFETLQKVEYEVQYDENPDLVFTAVDMHDGGMAGWNVTDTFEAVIDEEE